MNFPNSNHGFFPDEVILQILTKLPIKSLFRTKCVSKHWYQLSSDYYFTQLYNNLSTKTPSLLIELTESSGSPSNLLHVDYHKGVSEFPLEFVPDRVKVRASCNGLLCCSSIPDTGVYYVCNPMTREFKLLPRTRERPITRFHPNGEATLVGVACDLLTRNYNVVLAGYHRPFGHRPDKKFICLVFDSGTNKWEKSVSIQDDHFTNMNKNQVVFVNGSLHWMTESCCNVLVLDLNCVVWRKIMVPCEVSSGEGNRAYLLELDGCLSVIRISDSWMSIWVLKDYQMVKWELVDRVSLRCIKGMVPGIFPFSQNGECVFLATHKQVLVYHRKSRVWKEMYCVKNGSTLPLWLSAHAFRSSIFSCH